MIFIVLLLKAGSFGYLINVSGATMVQLLEAEIVVAAAAAAVISLKRHE